MKFNKRLLTLLLAAMSFGTAVPAIAQADAQTQKKVLGLVGEVRKSAKVYSKASMSSKAYFSVKEQDYLVVNVNAPQGWAKVLLNTGGYGYIPVEAIQTLDFEVTADVQTPRSQPVTSRGGAARSRAAEKGLDFLGTPYKWGGNDIEHGIDCSSFVQKLYGNFGLDLPRTAAEQAMVGTPIKRLEELQKGDRLYFWDAKRGKIGHTGMYLGDGKFVHSSSSRGGVAVDDIRDGKWMRILVAARR